MKSIEQLLKQEDFKQQVEFSEEVVHPKQVILAEGKRHDYFYLIVTGNCEVKTVVETDSTSEPIKPGLAQMGPGEVFGEFTLFDDTPASMNVIAVTQSKLIKINKKSFLNYIDQHPQQGYPFVKEVLNLLLQRMRSSNKAVVRLLIWGIKSHKIDQYL